MGSTRARRRASGDRGAALVEFALVFPILFMLMLGMFSGGLIFNQKLAMTNGVREGSRYGATLPVASAPSCSSTNTLDCWLQQVATITIQASEGKLDSGVSGRTICVAYVYPAGTASNDLSKKLTITGTQTPATGTLATGTCFTDSRPNSERRVQVSGSRNGKLEWLLGSSTLTLSTQSVTKFEGST